MILASDLYRDMSWTLRYFQQINEILPRFPPESLIKLEPELRAEVKLMAALTRQVKEGIVYADS